MLKLLLGSSHLQQPLLATVKLCFSTNFNAKTNYYEVLGITSRSTQQEIKKAFIGLAKQYHPDVNPKFQEKFKLINQAYQVLSNSIVKRQYEKMREGVQQQEEVRQGNQNQLKTEEKDPFYELFRSNIKYIRMKRKQRLNMHASRQFKSSLSNLFDQKQRRAKWDKCFQNLPVFLMAISLCLTAVIIKQVFMQQIDTSNLDIE